LKKYAPIHKWSASRYLGEFRHQPDNIDQVPESGYADASTTIG
jgi:hypothetical protein